MTRKVQSLPLWAGPDFTPGRDQYLPTIPSELRKRAVRWWSYGGILRSVQMPAARGGGNGEMVKTLAPWGGASGVDEILAHAEEVRAECGVRCVSGYGGAVRASLGGSLPIESRTHTAAYLEYVRAGWQEAIKPGVHAGAWKLYDLQSAYYWALLQGLPDPHTYRCTRVVGPHGLYLVRLGESNRRGLPHPFDVESTVLASYEDIYTYGLDVVEVLAGVRWTRDYDTRGIIHACDRWSFAKRARRCYWGAWAADRAVTCHTASGAEWQPLPPRPHPVWAALILGRVKRKVWEASTGAVHVYTDSLITRADLRTGTGVGDWRLVTTYPHGVRVGGAGQYGPARGPWDKWAGMPVTAPQRSGAALAAVADA